MKQFIVSGKFTVKFRGIVNAETEVEAEEKVARINRAELNKTVDVEGRPYDVKVEEVK